MNDKQTQIEKIADILCESKNHNCNGEDCKCIKQATDLYNADCRILDEGSVVLSKEEYEILTDISTLKNKVQEVLNINPIEELIQVERKARKQAVKEVIEKINKEYELFDDADEIFFSCLRKDIKRIAKEVGVGESCQEEESIIDVWCERKRRETNQND